MAHDHSHHHSRAEYYLEQIFTIGVCGALGIVAIRMYGTGKLYILNPSFHSWVLAGGIGLLIMAVVRGIAVWMSVEEPTAVAAHDHGDCGHDHAHDHVHA